MLFLFKAIQIAGANVCCGQGGNIKFYSLLLPLKMCLFLNLEVIIF